jgi:hypothetical protein
MKSEMESEPQAGNESQTAPAEQRTETVAALPREKRYRVIRVLEYTGTLGFIKNCLLRRSVKESMVVRSGVIHESFLRTFPFAYEEAEILADEELHQLEFEFAWQKEQQGQQGPRGQQDQRKKG